jgi:hypothetical protein
VTGAHHQFTLHFEVIPRQSSNLTGVCEHSDCALADGYRLRGCISFAAGFEKVIETGSGISDGTVFI